MFCGTVAAECFMFLVFCTCTSAVKGSIQIEFIKEPVSQNVSEGSQATFNCTATSLSQYWLINIQSITHPSNSIRGLVTKDYDIDDSTGLKTHLLTVPAAEINNGIIIQCVIYDILNPFVGSDKVILQIQRILEPVHSLQAVWLNSSSIQVSFSPPYTLDGVPIRNYTIELISTDTNSSTQYLTTVETIVIIRDMSWCYDHYITVSAWNDAGQGNETTIVLDKGAVMAHISLINTTVFLKYSSDDKHYPVFFTIVYTGFTADLDVISVTVHPVNNTDELSIFTANCIIDTPSQCDDVLIELSDSKDNGLTSVSVNLTDYIQDGYYYSASISITNCIGTINSSEYIFDHTVPNYTSNVNDHVTAVSNDYHIKTMPATATVSPSSAFVQIFPSTCHNCVHVNVTNTTINMDHNNPITPLGYIVIGLGIFCTLLIIAIIVLLLVGLMKYKKRKNDSILPSGKNGKHDKIIEVHQVIVNPNFINSSRHQVPTDVSSSLPPEGNNPLYENLDDVQPPRRQDTVEMVDCPAYGSLQEQKKTS